MHRSRWIRLDRARTRRACAAPVRLAPAGFAGHHVEWPSQERSRAVEAPAGHPRKARMVRSGTPSPWHLTATSLHPDTSTPTASVQRGQGATDPNRGRLRRRVHTHARNARFRRRAARCRTSEAGSWGTVIHEPSIARSRVLSGPALLEGGRDTLYAGSRVLWVAVKKGLTGVRNAPGSPPATTPSRSPQCSSTPSAADPRRPDQATGTNSVGTAGTGTVRGRPLWLRDWHPRQHVVVPVVVPDPQGPVIGYGHLPGPANRGA